MSDNRITDYSPPGGGPWPFGVSTAGFYAQTPVGQSADTPDLYAVAWTLAQRDHELDRLFNAAFYYEI